MPVQWLDPGTRLALTHAQGDERSCTALDATRTWPLFVEPDIARSQEFLLRWSPDGGTFRDIVRQQWNFGPPDTIREAEDYRVDLGGATVLELTIVPDRSGGNARASLAQWRLAA